MDWRDNAISDLKEYNVRKAGIDTLKKRIAYLESQMDGLKSQDLTIDRVQGGEHGDALLTLIDEKTRLESNLKFADEIIERVERGITNLTDNERKVLTAAYINRGDGYIETLCLSLGFERSQIYRIRDAALRKYTYATYGMVIS